MSGVKAFAHDQLVRLSEGLRGLFRLGLAKALQRREAAVISLFASIIMSGLCLILYLLATGIQSRRAELEVSDLLRKGPDLILSAYDPDLYDHYGLWGQRAEAAQTAVSEIENEIKKGMYPGVEFCAFDSVSKWEKEEDLKQQIASFMQSRVPEVIIRKFRDWGCATEASLSKTGELKSTLEQMKNNDAENLFQDLLGYADSGTEANVEGSEHQEPEKDEENKEQHEQKKRGGKLKKLLLEQVAASEDEMTNLNQFDELNEELFEGLEQISRIHSELKSIGQSDFYQHLSMAFYANRMFKSHLHDLTNLPSSYSGYYNLRHRLYSPKTSAAYLEAIMSGSRERTIQARWIKRGLRGLRFATHELSIHADRPQMNRIQIAAGIASGIIVLLSGGSVQIPPKALAEMIVFVRSALAAERDVGILLKGGRVAFLANMQKPVMTDYHDYCLFFLLIQDDASLARRIAEAIRSDLGGSWHTGVRFKITWKNPYRRQSPSFTFELPGRYRVLAQEHGNSVSGEEQAS